MSMFGIRRCVSGSKMTENKLQCLTDAIIVFTRSSTYTCYNCIELLLCRKLLLCRTLSCLGGGTVLSLYMVEAALATGPDPGGCGIAS